MKKLKVTNLVRNGAYESFLGTDKGLLNHSVGNAEAELLFGTKVNPDEFGGLVSKIDALARHLGVASSEVSQARYGVTTFECDREEYTVLDHDEREEMVTEYIKNTLWAFRAEFLAAHLKKGVEIEALEAIQANGKCEDNNAAILCLIEDFDHLVWDAVRSDGYGHFLSSYDGEEIDLVNGFYAYKQ